MAKQQKTPPTKTEPRKPAASGGFSAGGYILRNAAIIAVIALIFYVIDKRNEKQSQLRELTQEFYQLQRINGNQQRMQELYTQIMDIQNDTSLLTRVTRGYHWAIHDLAIGNMENIQEAKAQISRQQLDSTDKSLYDTKMGMKVGLYPLIQHMINTTPENAVILLPPGDSAISNNSRWNFIYDPPWTEYFIYPRLCLMTGKEHEHPDLAKRITHVLIIEGKGYDKLKYNVPAELRAPEAVLPIDTPPPGLKITQ